ncbi:protein GrpE [Methanobrevibacter woesei]|uniref:Protein GrpE n=1 Tax=Methanobrevibacter woesei TaxID=190976 RepID=A0A2U1S6H8_9EURY|nr:nucleotide exchange factor GrpE [Methanobrevibacter woesei]MCC9261121.1 nucleotide exchange factor GrpE [Methanobrevibacter woesei]PWB85726.1 protein GrpE [Methanobrevibacter woesei]
MANDKKDEKKNDLQEETQEELLEKLESKNEEIAKLQEELEKQEDQTNEYISYSQRLQADFENYKRHSEKQNAEIIKYANEQLISNILDSYEDLERALNQSNNEKELREGVELIYSKLKDILEKEGLKEIPTEGEKFDPFKHEALMAENNDDFENGYIIEELMKGYTLKDKVLKYSKVKVCKK